MCQLNGLQGNLSAQVPATFPKTHNDRLVEYRAKVGARHRLAPTLKWQKTLALRVLGQPLR